MVIISGTATVLQQFVSGLKSRNEDTRAKSAKDLQHYVTTELREVNTHDRNINLPGVVSAHKSCGVISCVYCVSWVNMNSHFQSESISFSKSFKTF